MKDLLSNFPESATSWPFGPVLIRLLMSVAIGVLVGLEREHSQKTGVRTFALTALLGCMGGMMGDLYAGIATGFFALAAVGICYRHMVQQQRLGLTTAAALVIVGFTGILFGKGHIFTPAVVGIVAVTLLAWKESISKFALGLTQAELRSAILLAILTFVIYPVLPNHPVDPWNLVQPRENWASVIIVAGIGFVNYVLMKLLGPRGMEITAFFGGLVNSRKIIVELGLRLRQMGESMLPMVHRGILLAIGAMLIRNGLIVAVLAPAALVPCSVPLCLMLAVDVALLLKLRPAQAEAGENPASELESPFSLSAALKFGMVFLLLNVVGALAERHFGSASFYFVCVAGGLLSSASSIASAATLAAHHELTAATGANGVVLSSITSVLANLPLIGGLVRDAALRRRLNIALWMLAVIGLAGLGLNFIVFRGAHPAP